MKPGRILFVVLFGACVLWMGGCISVAIYADYDYSRSIASYWNLSDKASTLQQKSAYLDQFCAALEQAGLDENNALFLKTPDNSTVQNFIALRSLQHRMHEIMGMDPTSFAYQTAIQQITAQEQGEAKAMLDEFEGAWYKAHHFLLWDWIGCCYSGFIVVLLIVCGILGFSDVLE
jgi:hypothetical protein